MRKLLLLAVGAVMLAGCEMMTHVTGPQIIGSGKSATVNRKVGSFTAVELGGSMDAVITIGKQSDIKVEGDDNIVPKITTEVRNGTLHVSLENGSYSTKLPLKVTFSVPRLDAASVNGSGDINLSGYHGDSLLLAINGSGDVTATGEAKTLKATINGSGDFHLFGIRASDVHVAIRGSGDAQVNATSSLQAAIAGSGDVRYKGHPHVTKSVAGSGDVIGER